jgi:RimJ/RimL family protein N-acetyltransferase
MITLGQIRPSLKNGNWEEFKEVIRAARKQKKHLRWVKHPWSIDLRDKSPWNDESEDRLAFVIYETTPGEQRIPVGLITTYPYVECTRCDRNARQKKTLGHGGNVSIGYWLLKEYTGSGITVKAVQQLIEILSHRGFGTFHACTAITNLASERVLEKLGFELVRASKRCCYCIDGEDLKGHRWSKKIF